MAGRSPRRVSHPHRRDLGRVVDVRDAPVCGTRRCAEPRHGLVAGRGPRPSTPTDPPQHSGPSSGGTGGWTADPPGPEPSPEDASRGVAHPHQAGTLGARPHRDRRDRGGDRRHHPLGPATADHGYSGARRSRTSLTASAPAVDRGGSDRRRTRRTVAAGTPISSRRRARPRPAQGHPQCRRKLGIAHSIPRCAIPALVHRGRAGRPGGTSDEAAFRDLRRDNDVVAAGDAVLRYGWRDVAGRPCLVAAQIGAVLRGRGWPGLVQLCGPECVADDSA